MTAKSTTKITKISTPRKLPAIRYGGKQQQKQTYSLRLRNVRAGYVLYRALVTLGYNFYACVYISSVVGGRGWPVTLHLGLKVTISGRLDCASVLAALGGLDIICTSWQHQRKTHRCVRLIHNFRSYLY